MTNTNHEKIYPYMPLFMKLARGAGTAEDREHYMNKYANSYEKKLGKPYFEFTDEEELDYKIMCANLEAGDLNKMDGTGYDCRECWNKGFIAVKQFGVYAERECKCMNIRKTLNQVKWSGLGDIFKSCTFDTFNCRAQWQTEIKNKALEFLTSNSNCFYIGGSSGSGKSHICTAIVGRFLKQGKDVNYVQWLDIVDDLGNTRYRQVDRYESILNKIRNAEVLYIDDFLKGDNAVKPSSADIKLAYRIINARYVKSKAEQNKRYITVISSEWALAKIESFDIATGGRIAELARGFIIRLDGDDKNQRRLTCR